MECAADTTSLSGDSSASSDAVMEESGESAGARSMLGSVASADGRTRTGTLSTSFSRVLERRHCGDNFVFPPFYD